MDEAVSCKPVTINWMHMDLWWMKWHWDRFLKYLVFPLVSSILPVLHTHISFICYWCFTLLAIDSAMKCNTMRSIMVLRKICGVSLVFSGTCWDTSWKAYTSISASFFLYCHSTLWSCVTCAVVIQKFLSTVVTKFIDSWFLVWICFVFTAGGCCTLQGSSLHCCR